MKTKIKTFLIIIILCLLAGLGYFLYYSLKSMFLTETTSDTVVQVEETKPLDPPTNVPAQYFRIPDNARINIPAYLGLKKHQPVEFILSGAPEKAITAYRYAVKNEGDRVHRVEIENNKCRIIPTDYGEDEIIFAAMHENTVMAKKTMRVSCKDSCILEFNPPYVRLKSETPTSYRIRLSLSFKTSTMAQDTNIAYPPLWDTLKVFKSDTVYCIEPLKKQMEDIYENHLSNPRDLLVSMNPDIYEFYYNEKQFDLRVNYVFQSKPKALGREDYWWFRCAE